MSTDTERIEEGTETSVLEMWEDWYHIPVVGVVMLFMFWVRTQAYDNFVTEDGSPALAGVDSWYHWRTVEWTAENYPWTMPYEVWTSFPTGRYVGQFGTLFDQLIVTAAMIVGLGDPSTETLYTVALLAVPAMAALVAIPVFFIGRRLGGTIGGIVSVLLLALVPGQFLHRTNVGSLQHHVGEVLFMAIAVLAMMVALRAAEREQPIYELVVDKDWDTLRRPAIYSALAGVALSLYIWVWPPGVVLIGILAVFFTVQLCFDYVRNVSPDHVAFVGAVSLGLTALITALLIEEPGTSTTSFGYLQPASAALVAAGCLFMAWFARQWNAHEIDRQYYPAAIAGLLGATFAVMWLVLPDLFSTIVSNLTRRVIPFGATATDLTIQEAQPPGDFTEFVVNEFGMAFYTMLAGLVLLVARPFLGREYRTEYTLIVVWSLFLISMAATQVRFSYYLVLAVVTVNAVFVADLVSLFDLDLRENIDSLREIEGYQVLVLLMVVLLLFAPLLPPVAADGTASWEQADGAQPSGDSVVWEGSNEWLAENTPEPGNWGGAGYEDELEYHGTYEYPDGGDYDYPPGSYGVISWWDYGHLITTQAERIPHSNPFQSNARSSSAFFTAESEDRSELILDAVAAGASPDDHTNEELEQMIAEGDELDEEIRYVMIDYQMAGDKFPAMATWTDPGPNYYMTAEDYQPGQPIEEDEVGEIFGDIPYHETTLSNLYFDDADGMENYRLVHENAEAGSVVYASYAQIDDGEVVHFDEMGQPVSPAEGEPAVAVNEQIPFETYQQLEENDDIVVFDARTAAAVKTYERVEGATLEGSIDGDVDDIEDATVTAAVQLDAGEREPFIYTQDAELEDDGSFEMTVPYATDDELGVEDGYTDSSVDAIEEYVVSAVVPSDDGMATYEGETAVPETAVVEGETVDVTLEEAEAPEEIEAEADDDADIVDDSDDLESELEDDDIEDEPGDTADETGAEAEG
ncbi:oligosaccharyl transferase, archaeosortase A system-associated [Salinadaptatus halalkaliphilus]|uniref:dolichyl-phosphooligosaccharide-protein glycotransferase n=1 Tax=Salinadaptatus halalkaliphilus TaxID=2419781 RepID=A0A4S3TQC0_9EURY|nr:oligosaccharyl transferase, archaeosortase A system-associated [Salinadaptatus halalkaliphilus]THE65425.1 oligosaccharyl transferase, archaeosortase A system-associated [Salinadaptatus halalkaliphilus]